MEIPMKGGWAALPLMLAAVLGPPAAMADPLPRCDYQAA